MLSAGRLTSIFKAVNGVSTDSSSSSAQSEQGPGELRVLYLATLSVLKESREWIRVIFVSIILRYFSFLFFLS